MKLIEGKKILITGGSRGIGAGIVRACAENGAQVAFTYSNNKDSADKILSELPGSGHMVVPMQMEDDTSIQSAVDQVLGQFGVLDGVVNNAGITKDQLLLRMAAEDFDKVYRVNLRGSFLCSKYCLKPMLRNKGGSFVHITSVVGQTGNPGQTNYTATKAGLEAFSKSLALEIASRGIRSNCVSPGFIQTDMTEKLTEDQKKKMADQIPQGTIGTPQDVANAVLFLLSDLSKYITGQTINVNGGLHM
jgi:3-oxoacyl-[acyl-carrier protein] reductase